MSAAVTRTRSKQTSSGANAVEPPVDHEKLEPRVDGDPQQQRGKTKLTTDTDTNSANANGMTPLMRAAGDGLVDFVQVLLDRGADVNAKRNDGFFALALAAFFGHSQVVRLLLERGAEVEATTRFGTSAEMWADARGFIEIGDLLRETRERNPVQEPAPLPAVLQEHPRFPRPVAEESREEVGILKTLPEIPDPPRIIVPEFHPGSAFVARISSSWKNQAALVIVVLIACGIATFAVPQVVRELTRGNTGAVTNTTDLPEASGNPVAQPEQRVSSPIEAPPAAPVELGTAAVSKAIEETANDSKTVESTGQSEPDSSGAAKIDKPESGFYPRSRNTVSKSFTKGRGLSVATTLSRPSASAMKRETVPAAGKPEQQALDPDPQPAPLSMEVRRSRTVLSTAPSPANERSGGQSTPLGITPSNSKTKVIPWP